LPESGERFAERFGTEVSADRDLATHEFQNPLLGRRVPNPVAA